MNHRLVLFVDKTDVVLRRYISSLRFVADGELVAGGLASFLHTRNRQFLAPFHPAFQPLPSSDLHPFRRNGGPRYPFVDPFFLYSLFTSFARIIPPSFFVPLFANHLASRSLRFLSVSLFLLFLSYSISLHRSFLSPCISPSFLPRYHISFAVAFFLFSFFSSFSLSLLSLLKLSPLTHSNFLFFFFSPLKLYPVVRFPYFTQCSFINVFYLPGRAFSIEIFWMFLYLPLIYSLCKLPSPPFHPYFFYI